MADSDAMKTLMVVGAHHDDNELVGGTMLLHAQARWRVELFFKWIKQHLRIQTFYGTSENAVKTQIWIAVAVYVLIAIIKKRLQFDQSLYTILQILSVTIFEKTPILQAFCDQNCTNENTMFYNQLSLFDL